MRSSTNAGRRFLQWNSLARFAFATCPRVAVIAVCLFISPLIVAQEKQATESTINELSEEEQQQVKTAERFLGVLEKNPRRGTALDRVYGHHVEFGTLDSFIALLKQRVEKSPNDGATWMLVGLFESQRGNDGDAVAAYLKAEQLRPQDPMSSYYLGQAQVRLGDTEVAAKSLERALERKPQRADQLEIFQTLGRLHQRAQRTQEALQVWQRLEKLFPGDARVLEQIAVTLSEENQPAEALPRFQKLVELVTDDYRRVTFKIAVAELTIKTGKKSEGIQAFEGILSTLNPDSWLYRDVRRRIDDVFLRSGDQDGLVKYYQSWLDSHADDIEGMTRLARFLSGAARVPESLTWLEKALKLAPSRADLRKAYIDLLAGEQRFDDASKQYQELLKNSANNPDYLREWGKLVMRNRERPEDQRRDEAFQIWNRMIDPKAKDAVTVSQVADLCRQNQLLEKAEQLYRQAIDFSPNDPQYREYLGEFLHVQKRTDEALKVWSEIAAGTRRSASNLARLAEVFNSFGYAEQACQQIAEAINLDGKNFSLILKSAEYHNKSGKHDEALAMCDQAQQLVANEDENEEVIKQRISVLQANQQLEEIANNLLAEYQKPDARPAFADWYRLARYFESMRRWNESTSAIEQSLKLQPKSIQALTTSARIAEGSGEFGRAADLNRQLADVDRRSQGDHLINVSRLEAQLGRTKEALEAAQRLIIAAPSKTENYEFYAQTCFRLGKPEEGLTALRKAMRINPNEPSLMQALASALADQMRTEEAIEVYWRAFEKAAEVDDKTTITQRIAPLYQIINQTDKLFERLERGRQDDDTRRAFTICIAQAWQTIGDLTAARKELESLLSENTRDTNLLSQLSKLCENDGDIESAINYQRQLVSIAPGDETETPLASMYVRNGRYEDAKEIYQRLIQREEDPVRQLRSLDSLLTNGNNDSAIQIIEPLLEKQRDDWELLYRQGVAWANLNNPGEAKSRFDRILALSIPFDTLGKSAEAKLKQAQAKAKSDNLRGVQTALPQRETPLAMSARSAQVSQATGLVADNSYVQPGTLQPIWMPEAYGLARMAVYGWLLRFEQEESQKEDSVVSTNADAQIEKDRIESLADRIRKKAESDGAQRNEIYDWLYIARLKSDYPAVFKVSKILAASGGKEEQRFLLSNLKLRESSVSQYGESVQGGKPSPLSQSDLTLVEQCFESLSNNDKDVDPSVIYGSNVAYGSNGQVYVLVGNSYQMMPGVFRNNGGFVSQMIEEYRLAGKEEVANNLIERQVEKAKTTAELAAAIGLQFQEKRYDDIPALLDKWQIAAAKQVAETPIVTGRSRTGTNTASANVLGSVSNSIQRLMSGAVKDDDAAKIVNLLDKVLPVAMAQAKYRIQLNAAQARPTAMASANFASSTQISIYSGEQQNRVNIVFPTQNMHLDLTTITLLRQAYDSLNQVGATSDLAKLLNSKLQAASPEQKTFYLWCCAAVNWWSDEIDQAMSQVAEIAATEKQDVGFQFMLAGLHQSRNEFEEAINILEAIPAKDQSIILRREMGIMNAAERLGDLDKARQAAQKVFGLRMDSQTQQSLIAQMRRLGLEEHADAIMARFERTAGRQVSSLVSLMNLQQAQGKTELANQTANNILRKTASPYAATSAKSARNPARYSNSDSQSRQTVLRILQQTGALKTMIQQLKEQLERTPDSARVIEQLAEFTLAMNSDDAMTYFESLAKLRPESPIYHYQIATMLTRKNKFNEACDHYLAILKSSPKWLSDNLSEVDRVFKQAKRSKELVEFIAKIDVRGMEPYYLIQTATNLMNESQNAELAIKLIDKVLAQNPNYRRYALSNMSNNELLKNEKLYQVVKKAMLPTPATTKSNPWYGVEEVRSYSGDGRVNTIFQDTIGGLRSTANFTDFEKSLEKTVKEQPDWLGGQAILALQEIRSGNKSDGVAKLEQLVRERNRLESIPSQACWILGQEFAEFEKTHELAAELLERARKTSTSSNEPNYTPLPKLIALYSKMDGKKDLAYQVLREEINKLDNVTYSSNSQYESSRRVQSKIWFAEKLESLGRPADSIQLLRTLLTNKAALEQSDQWNGGSRSALSRVENGISSAMAALEKTDARQVVEQLLPDNEKYKLDLLVNRPTLKDLEKQPLNCGLMEVLAKVAKSDSHKQLVTQRLDQLKQAHPNDISTAIASVMWALAMDQLSDESFSVAAKELLKLTQLEVIEEGRRASSKQRSNALPIVDLWLVAKQANSSAKLDEKIRAELASQLAQRALDAATRQLETTYSLPILFEWGNNLVSQGQHAKAEPLWTRALTLASTPTASTAAISERQQGGFGPSASTLALPMPAAPAQAAARTSAPGQPAPAGSKSKLIAPLTLPQFQSTMTICKAAAKSGMLELASKAFEQSLKGGMPIPDPIANSSDPNNPFSSSRSSTSQSVPDLIVGQALQEVVPLLQEKAEQVDQLFNTVMSLVLPPARPNEIRMFLSAQNNGEIRNCLGANLVELAVKSNRIDALKNALSERKNDPRSAPAKQVLLLLVALAQKDNSAAKDALQQLSESASKIPASHELALLVAKRAFDIEELKEASTPILKLSFAARAVSVQSDPFSSSSSSSTFSNQAPWVKKITLQLQKHYISTGDKKAAQQLFDARMAERQSYYSQYSSSPDYLNQLQRTDFQSIAVDAFTIGLSEYALDIWGRSCDLERSRWDYGTETNSPMFLAVAWARQLSPDQRYAVWHQWTMPIENRLTVRAEYDSVYRAPLPDAFNQKNVGQFVGLFSNLSELVDAAKETGKLEQLTAEADLAIKDKLANAETLRTLISIARGDVNSAGQAIEKLISGFSEAHKHSENEPPKKVWPEVLVFQQALKDRSISSSVLGQFSTIKSLFAKSANDGGLGISLLHDQILRNGLGNDQLAVKFKHWEIAESPSQLSGLSMWSKEGNQVVRFATSSPQRSLFDHSQLMLKYPLQGNFTIRCEMPQAFLGFGGLVLNPRIGRFANSGQDVLNRNTSPSWNDPLTSLTVKVEDDHIKYIVRNMEVYDDQFTRTYPWLTLLAQDSGSAFWQNLLIEGEPTIPRQVPLVHDNFMDGWNCFFFNESHKPLRSSKESSGSEIAYDEYQNGYTTRSVKRVFEWAAEEGQLVYKGNSSGSPKQQSWIYYHRPLLAEETIRYEFFYQPDRSIVHPTLGRLAFVLEDSGVKTRYITRSMAEEQATGLSLTNSLLEADCQRHSGKLPLLDNSWNKVQIKRTGEAIQLTLNGELIFERKLDPRQSSVFGLYRTDNYECKVKEIYLSGNWPEKLDQTVLADLLAVEQGLPDSVRPALEFVLDDSNAIPSTASVAQQARTQSPEFAYDSLLEWVLPPQLARMRIYNLSVEKSAGESPTSLPAPVFGKPWIQIESPAIELARIASKLGRSEQLLKTIEQRAEGKPDLVREANALRAIVLMEAEQASAAKTLIEQMVASLDTLKKAPEGSKFYAPEFTTAWRALRTPETRPAALLLAQKLQARERDEKTRSDDSDFDSRLASLVGDAMLINDLSASPNPPEQLKQWTAVEYLKSNDIAANHRSSTWVSNHGKLQHYPAEAWSQLYFQSPLRGKFEITADRTTWGYKEVSIAYGMHSAEPNHDLQHVQNITMMHGSKNSGGPIEVPGFKDKDIAKFRIQVDGKTVTTWTNGVQIYQHTFPDQPDPWIVLQSNYAAFAGRIENLRITGNPEIPNQIDLIHMAGNHGWRADFYHESFGLEEHHNWNFTQEILNGRVNRQMAGSKPNPSYIRYQRPMLEDGVIEYEFWLESGKVEVHPTVGGQAYLLQHEKQPAIHHLVSYSRESRNLEFDNSTPLADSEKLSLKQGDWNQVRLEIKGNELTIQINGSPAVKQTLTTPTAQRHFGFFRYSNLEARVRKLTYSGQWPKSLPAESEQELATSP